jgi:hypothetical protein
MKQAPRGGMSKKARVDREARRAELEALTDGIQAIRKRFAPKILAAAMEIEKAVAAASALEKEMRDECIKLAGGEHGLDGVHTISYQADGGSSLDEMESLGAFAGGPNLEDIADAVRELITNSKKDSE